MFSKIEIDFASIYEDWTFIEHNFHSDPNRFSDVVYIKSRKITFQGLKITKYWRTYEDEDNSMYHRMNITSKEKECVLDAFQTDYNELWLKNILLHQD